MSSYFKLISSAGSLFFAQNEVRNAYKEKRKLDKGIKNVEQQMTWLRETVGFQSPQIPTNIKHSANEMVQKARGRLKSEKLTLLAGSSNFLSASLNAVVSGMEIGGDTSSILGFLQNVGSKVGWSCSGAANALKGGFQAAACIRATQKTIATTDAQVARLHKLDAINQGVQAAASLSTAGAAFASACGVTVSLSSSIVVAPVVFVAVGAGAISYGANYYFRKKIADIRSMNNAEVLKALLEVAPTQSEIETMIPKVAAIELTKAPQLPAPLSQPVVPLPPSAVPAVPPIPQPLVPEDITVPVSPEQEPLGQVPGYIPETPYEDIVLQEIAQRHVDRMEMSISVRECEDSQDEMETSRPKDMSEQQASAVSKDQTSKLRECPSCIVS